METIKYGRKRKGIKKELESKIEDWISSIDDQELQIKVRKNTIVTGGSICSMLLGEPINDFDIYFQDISTTKAVAEYYVNKFNESNKKSVKDYEPFVKLGERENIRAETEQRVMIWAQSAGVAGEEQAPYEYFETLPEDETFTFAESLKTDLEPDENNKYRCVFISENAITLSDKMQIIIRFYGEPEQIHKNFDFAHAMCWWHHGRKSLYLDPVAMECMLSRTLIYTGSLYPIASIFRMKKFIERGWRITAGQQLKIMWQISEINMNDFDVLREQLTGVDQAYMQQLIDALQIVDPNKIDAAYVSTIIDMIFD